MFDQKALLKHKPDTLQKYESTPQSIPEDQRHTYGAHFGNLK